MIDNDYPWEDLKAEFLRWAKQSVRNPEMHERDLKRFETYCRITSVRQIDHEYIVGYRNWRAGQEIDIKGKRVKSVGKLVCARTINREVNTLRAVLNRGVAWKRIATNAILGLRPLRHDTPRKDRRALTVAEIEALFRETPDHLRPVLRLFATTGIRKEELTALRFSDIDFENRCLTIRAEVAKNHKPREIPLDDETFGMLVKLREQAKQRQPIDGQTAKQTEQQRQAFSREHVFVSRANTPLKNNLLRTFYAICRKAGIEGAESGGSVDLHSLRVTFATLSLENGASPKAVQEILGHSTLAMTMGVYAKATERAKRNAVASLPFATVTKPAHIVSMDELRTVSATASKLETQTKRG
jgi:integrase